MLPPEMREVLRGLQSHAPPVAFTELRPVLEAELDAEARGQFACHLRVALASASSARCIERRFSTGPRSWSRSVPRRGSDGGVGSAEPAALRALGGQGLGLQADVGKFLAEARSRLLEELDYRLEAETSPSFARASPSARYLVPRPHPRLCTGACWSATTSPASPATRFACRTCAELQDAAAPTWWTWCYGRSASLGCCRPTRTWRTSRFARTGGWCCTTSGASSALAPRSSTHSAGRCATCSPPRPAAARGLEAVGYVSIRGSRLPLEVYAAYADVFRAALGGPSPATSALPAPCGGARAAPPLLEELLHYDAPADAMFLVRTWRHVRQSGQASRPGRRARALRPVRRLTAASVSERLCSTVISPGSPRALDRCCRDPRRSRRPGRPPAPLTSVRS